MASLLNDITPSRGRSYKTTLTNVLEMAVPVLGDWCVIEVVGEHFLGALRAGCLFNELYYSAPLGARAWCQANEAMEDVQPEIFDNVATVDPLPNGLAAQNVVALFGLGDRSCIIMPLVSDGHRLGMLILGAVQPNRYSSADLTLATALAQKAASAIWNSRRRARTSDSGATELSSQVQSRLNRQIRNFRLVTADGGIILYGRARSYYAKQLAQQAVMKATNLPIFGNEIEVR